MYTAYVLVPILDYHCHCAKRFCDFFSRHRQLIIAIALICNSELVMGWVHPWVRLGWVRVFFNFWWVGLGWVGLGGDLTA